MKRTKKIDPRTGTIVGAGTRVRGDIEFVGNAVVIGCAEGNFKAVSDGATLTIAAGAKLLGSIEVPRLVVHGEVEGRVYVTELLELSSTARMQGDVQYNQLLVPAGAQITATLIPNRGPADAARIGTDTEFARRGPLPVDNRADEAANISDNHPCIEH